MKLGLTWGYWGALPPGNLVELTQEAERLGFDSVWSAEAWGSDAFGPLAYLAAHTSTIRLGTGVVQLSGRTPTATAMHAVTLDHLSQGRLILGLGVSGPQVVEGWYGQPYRKPLTRTREYVEIIRRVLAREEPLKIITHPYRREIPIFLGAEGPKNVAMTAEIADGWLPLYYSPFRQEVYAEQLAGAKEGFEVTAMANITVTEDIESALYPVKAALGFYIGGMGAKGKNFHTDLMARMGYEEEAYKIQDLFFEGKRDEAIALVPDQFADEISLIGPPSRIRERLTEWEKSPVTTVTMYPSTVEQMRLAADVILS